MKFTDRLTIDGTRKRADGALLVDARVARTGIQIYGGFEVGRPDLATVRVYRSADEVFHQDALASFAHRPITIDHPKDFVDASNWRDLARGQTADEVKRDGDFVRVPMMISDAEAIRTIEAGKNELSAGYVCDLDWTPGIDPNGHAFDAQQKTIRANHIACVDAARGGKNLRIGDGEWIAPFLTPTKDAKPMSKIVTLDGMPFPVNDLDQAASIIDRLNAKLVESTAATARLTADHSTALAAKDTKIGELTAEVKTLKDAAVTPERLATMIADRARLESTAKAVVPTLDCAKMTDADVRKAVVTAKLGAETVKDASDAVIEGMFRAVTKDAKPADQFADAMRDRAAPVNGFVQLADNGYQDRLDKLTARLN